MTKKLPAGHVEILRRIREYGAPGAFIHGRGWQAWHSISRELFDCNANGYFLTEKGIAALAVAGV